MASRTSGTRNVAPLSGSVTSNSGLITFTQNNQNQTNITSDETNIISSSTVNIQTDQTTIQSSSQVAIQTNDTNIESTGTFTLATRLFTVNTDQSVIKSTTKFDLTTDNLNLTGPLNILDSLGNYVATITNTASNVGSIVYGTNDPITIDQTLYSTTQLRQMGQAYFSGGVGIEKDLAVGGFIFGRIAAANTASTATDVTVVVTNNNDDYFPTFTDASGLISSGAQLYADTENGNNLPGPNNGLRYNPYTGKLKLERILVTSTDNATSTSTGSIVVLGGIGVGRDVYVGGNTTVNGLATFTNTLNAISTSVAALVVGGGIGIAKDIVSSGNILPSADNTGTIGNSVVSWRDSYLNNIYTRFLGNTNSNITLSPSDGNGIVDIFGDIRVRGSNPIGTAPMVTNTLYVTMDGDDTNDGRAMDPSRACRTIGGAMKSPYYQPGTQILVSAGRYLENNPLEMKPYTSVRGSDIRTTFIEPINKTQDLFHMNSGCYLNYMNFLNGRSGRLPGQYDQRFNRGAYCAAFPPLTGSERIDLFQSPYIQNCTNQSGPWLNDGTMFLPNQTVQVPQAVAMGSWEANTASIVVTVEQGTLSIGQSINAGKQNPGFFNARTLILANKPFIQNQAVAWVNANYPDFKYNEQLCFRDAGILVENMCYDMAFGGNQKSIESGQAYYQGVTSVIAGQETQTVGAINYIKTLCRQVAVNSTCTVLSPPANIPYTPQVFNSNLIGGSIANDSISNLFDIVGNIITNGPDATPDMYVGPGPDAAFVSAEILLQANRTFIQENTLNYINYNLCYPSKSLPYNQIKCKRDGGIILDSVAADLLFPTTDNSQSTFAALQYYIQGGYTGNIPSEITATIAAISYLRDLSIKVVQNITPDIDAINGITRYTNGVQTTSSNYATANEVAILTSEFSNVITILNGRTIGWTDLIVPNGGTPSMFPSVQDTYNLLLANTDYLKGEVIGFITANYPTLNYNSTTCSRDVGYIIDSIAFDLLYGGNRQSIQSGLSYYTNLSSATVIPSEINATIDAFNFMANLAETLVLGNQYAPLQTVVKPVLNLPVGDTDTTSKISSIFSTITNILASGPSVAPPLGPISLIQSSVSNVKNAYNIIEFNKAFIVAEMIAYLDNKYNSNSFNYNQELCYRDVGLIVDAVSQDILLGGNQKTIEAGLSYWNQAYNYVSGQLTTTTAAINYVRDIALQIIANNTVTSITGTVATQVINTFFQYGDTYMPQEAVTRNFNIVTTIINDGPSAAPQEYAGGGLFGLTGLNGSSVKIAPKVTSLNKISTNTYRVGLDTATIGFGNNATLYFGGTEVYPLQDAQVEQLSLEYTGNSNTWNERKVDPLGAMGGTLIDGAVISDRSPIQSFVFDAFTQLNQGGIGVKVTNNGYAQLVSVFTIFCNVGVQCDNGGIASITNSNCNFGDISLVAKGYGPRSFSGTVFNPAFRAYPFSPNVPGGAYLDQFYPDGYWPNSSQVEVFVPDTANRPHIGLVMEIIPPEGHINEQGFAGFLNAQPSTSTLTTGTIELVNIDTTDVYIGNTVFIRDQFGRQHDDNGVWYAATGTVVTDVNYNSISLNQALGSGGGDPTNPTYFTIYFCGNSYYTVQTSSVANSPYAPNTNILSANYDPYYQGPSVSQIYAHIQSLEYLNTIVDSIINNVEITPTVGNSSTQYIDNTVTGGILSKEFIDLRFGYMIDIIGAANISAANAVVPQSQITTSGTIPQGAGSAIILIQNNLDFLANEIAAYVNVNFLSSLGTYNQTKCVRDVKLILQQLIYDLETGGNYNSVYSGLSYWSRAGTYHLVELGEPVTRPDLFPDGSTVNFYQRSYISASGYLFEYVGAGTNYGALPQRGVADPVQSKEVVQLNAGKVFYTSTDQNGDFRIGPGLVISQATGVLSGRTFVQSLYANMTPFILAIE
jgi:hypothetical protein